MAFWRKIWKKSTGLFYVQAVTVDDAVTTDEVADRLSRISTVSRGDTYAVLKDLGSVLADFMAEGRTVKLSGMGTFYYTINSAPGVKTAEEVSAKMIEGVRVRFIPEVTRTQNNKVATRSLVSDKIRWEEWTGEKKVKNKPEEGKKPEEGGEQVTP